jgi:hypothetical protein
VILSIFSLIPDDKDETSHQTATDIIAANGYVYRVFLYHNGICNTANEDRKDYSATSEQEEEE